MIGRHRDMEDRISWCLAVGRYEAALALAEADRSTSTQLWDDVVQVCGGGGEVCFGGRGGEDTQGTAARSRVCVCGGVFWRSVLCCTVANSAAVPVTTAAAESCCSFCLPRHTQTDTHICLEQCSSVF